MRKLLSALAVIALLIAIPMTASAADIFGGASCNDPQNANSAVCVSKTKDPNENPISGKDGLLIKITNIIAFIAGAAAIIIILVSSVRYVTSGGDSGKVSTAKNGIIYAVVGLIVITLGDVLINYVVRGL